VAQEWHSPKQASPNFAKVAFSLGRATFRHEILGGSVKVYRCEGVPAAVQRAFLNAAALRAVGYAKDTPEPPAGEIVRDGKGNPTRLLLAKPNALIL